MSREALRQLIHFGMCGWSLLFPWIGKRGAVALAIAAVLFNALVFPRLPIGKRVRRETEGGWTGVQWYPVSVLGLVLALPLPLAAAGWGILAAGDSASNLVGKALGVRRLPWNPRKSWAGSIAFVLAAAPVALLLAGWNLRWSGSGAASLSPWIFPVILASAAAAAAESLPLAVDDNLTVAIASGATLGLAEWLRP